METNENFDSDDDLFNEDDILDVEKETEKYKDFFYTDNESIIVNIFYINRNNELFFKKNLSCNIKNNILTRNEITEIIKTNMKHENKKYRLLSMLTYNFDLDNEEVKKFFKNTKKYDILKVHKNLSNIKWNKTINFFKDLNEIYLFFIQKKNQDKNKTRRIFIKNKKLKKTKRKRLK
jgi:hypothetical protein